MKGEFSKKECAIGVPSVFQTEPEMKSTLPSFLCKVLAVTIAGVVLIAVTTVVVLVAVRHGSNMAPSDPKEYHVTYLTPNDDIEEHVYVSDREEMFETENVTAVFDYQTGFVVYQFHQVGSKLSNCYVTNFDTSAGQDPSGFKDSHTESQVKVPSGVVDEYMEITDVKVNKQVLGPQGKALCSGKDLYFMKTSKESSTDVREKRAADTLIVITDVVICGNGGCIRVIIIDIYED